MQQHKIYLLLLFIYLPGWGIAQSSKVSEALAYHLKQAKKNNEHVAAILVFRDQVDAFALKQSFQREGVPVAERPRILERKLTQTASSAQKATLDYLYKEPESKISQIKPLWIVNAIAIHAEAAVIDSLANREEIEFLVWDDPIAPLEFESVSPGNKAKALNAAEPGLEAVGARFMWDLGYTGHGTLVYNLDTGVWPEHPALKGKFLGEYLPLTQSWYGWFSDVPNGHVSFHGTHTNGTTIGLDTATNDTIGLAFGAYYIASDHITSTVGMLAPKSELMACFEWAINPDGDTNTVGDVPDVINNSWRWYDVGDTIDCTSGLVVNLMNAVEAAGIANVWSAGNFGPVNTTMASPQRVATSDVNTFTVGSVLGSDPSFPISSFSSRGPTQCSASGAIAIKPEVVAPGQTVRSASDRYGDYSIASGTSMSAPHVSGAVLLLKEAFPLASGEELLRALYLSADDLGPAGEDTIYGRGMINLENAYNLLAFSYTPTPPAVPAYDVAIRSASPEGDHRCEASTPLFAVIENRGLNPITNAILTVTTDGTNQQAQLWTDTLMTGGVDTIHFANAPIGPGYHTFEYSISVPSVSEYDTINNHRIERINLIPSSSLPFYEDFEENGIDPQRFYVYNHESDLTWDTTATSGLPDSKSSAVMDFFHYFPGVGERDELFLPQFSAPSTGKLSLEFELAYQRRTTMSSAQDTLMILASSDCGKTWPYQLYYKSAADLNTFDTVTFDFTPSQSHHWRTETVDLSALAGAGEVLIKMVTRNKRGNNLYIDNIHVFEGEPAAIEQTVKAMVHVYPNPAKEFLHVKFSDAMIDKARLRLIDASGRIVIENQYTNGRGEYAFHLSGAMPGTYVLEACFDGSCYNTPVIKQ